VLGWTGLLRYPRDMRESSDEVLMIAYGTGDVAAFELLYERYRGPLYRYFRRQLADATAANDLYQGCWEKVIKARGRYRKSSPFKAWLFRIAHNHLVDFYRAARPAEPLSGSEHGPDHEQPLATVTRSERQALFRSALIDLPPEQRDVLLLKLESGFNIEEIGRITGVGSETAKSRLRYATRKLKQVLQS